MIAVKVAPSSSPSLSAPSVSWSLDASITTAKKKGFLSDSVGRCLIALLLRASVLLVCFLLLFFLFFFRATWCCARELAGPIIAIRISSFVISSLSLHLPLSFPPVAFERCCVVEFILGLDERGSPFYFFFAACPLSCVGVPQAVCSILGNLILQGRLPPVGCSLAGADRARSLSLEERCVVFRAMAGLVLVLHRDRVYGSSVRHDPGRHESLHAVDDWHMH